MGIFNWAFGQSATPTDLSAYGSLNSGQIASPWSDGQLDSLVFSDIFGTNFRTVTRAEALSVPAVAQGRAIILDELAHRPLRALDTTGPLGTQPTWLYRTDSAVTPWHRMAATLDDWIFYGWSLWAVKRGADGKILDAIHVPYSRWETTSDGELRVDNKPVDESEVLLLPGPFDGLLNVAQSTLRAAKDLEASWAAKAKTPAPVIVLKSTSEYGPTKDEAKALVADVARARLDPDGAVMFLPFGIEADFQGDTATDLLIEGRNSARLDVAAFLNLPATALGAALPKASLNYETTEGQQITLADRLTFWTAPLEARLSMDDVTPRGTRIRFDFSDDPTAPGADTGPYTED